MNDNDKLFELMAQIYSEMKNGFDKADERFNDLENEVKKTNLTIENNIIPKINALFDGYKQNADKLDHIEAEVVKHEEFIIKQIK
jgi:hypothetical protein